MEKTKTISPRISEKTRDFLLGLGGTANGGAETVLATISALSENQVLSAFQNQLSGIDYTVKALNACYRASLKNIKGIFNASELSLMLDVMSGLFLTPQIAGQHLASNVSDGMALDALDEKWAVDSEVIIEKLDELTQLEMICLELWCRAFWESGIHKEESSFENYIAQLAA